MFTPRPLIPLSALLCACLGLLACGGGSHSKQPSAASNSSAAKATQASGESQVTLAPVSNLPPATVLASVAQRPITVAAVEHLIAIKSAPEPAPDPPSYESCVAHLKAKAAAQSLAAAAAQSEEQLKQSCQQSYQRLLQAALAGAIHDQWLLGEAAEEKIDVSQGEVQSEFEQSKKSSFRTEAEFQAYRKSTGQSVSDMLSELKLGKLSNAIFENIKRKERPPTSAEVAAYYDSHAKQYTIPEGRDVRILRTLTEASALKAKQELQSGKSFQSLAKGLSGAGIAQPLTAKDGEIARLEPTLFGEKSLNDAIFSAKLNQLSGPVNVIAAHKTIAKESGSGSYVFEVMKVIPASRTPLSRLKATIAQQLSEAKKTQTLAAFVAAFRSKWRARTDCQPGYVIRNCRQYQAAKGAVVEDPYTL